MNAAIGTLRRRERELLARRRKAEGRASRERSRNSRVALACFAALAAAITFGVRTTWSPPAMKLAMNIATDPDSRKFAENHIGRLFFDSLDGAICREMKFNNDNGRFSDERSMRCDESRLEEISTNAPQTDARARAASIRSGFSSR
jgi:hypothetical protein